MTVVQVLFILAIVTPIAVVLMYFIANMMDDYKLLRDGDKERKSSGSDVASDIAGAETIKDKHDNGKKSGLFRGKSRGKSSKKKREKDYSPVPESKDPVFSQEPVKRKQYYNPKPIKPTADYPKDPFADYKRPDFDSYIKNGNARDRIERNSVKHNDDDVLPVKTKVRKGRKSKSRKEKKK